MPESHTIQIGQCLDRMRSGDERAREELFSLACDRLLRMTAKIKREFPAVGRWEQTEDVFQNAGLRLSKALAEVEVNDVRHFYRLAAVNIRRELIDLCRHHLGPQGRGSNHQTQGWPPAAEGTARPAPLYDRLDGTHDPQKMAEWADFHRQVEALPDDARELFDLLWYNDLSHAEAAELLGISERQVRRRWRSVRLQLHKSLAGPAGSDDIPRNAS